jgi:hypothetical protein
MAVTAVWMATMLPAWRQQAIREKKRTWSSMATSIKGSRAHYLKNNCTLPADGRPRRVTACSEMERSDHR